MSGSWHEPLAAIVARGELVPNVGGLAGLADARRAHEGQFSLRQPWLPCSGGSWGRRWSRVGATVGH